MEWSNSLHGFWEGFDDDSSDRVCHRVVQSAQVLGFSNFYYEHKLPLPFGESRWYSAGTAPVDNNSWLVAARGLLALGRRRIGSFVVPLSHLSRECLSLDTSEFARIPEGFLVPILGYSGARALFCVYRFASADGISPTVSKDSLLSLAHAVHWSLASVSECRLLQSFPVLSEREREVLRWTADGKSAEDVGHLLQITSDTVNYHLKMTRSKLACASKAACVGKAAALGLLA